jgi:segregation and condensation protein A
MGYKIKLDVFEGPFDLLLFLIRKNEVDIYDIPIHDITEQFLEYIELMKILDLEVAGEFIEMVAILMNIKARMLLPRPVHLSEEEYEDPRSELVEKLIEYKRYKEAALEMAEYEQKRLKLYARKYFSYTDQEQTISPEEYLHNITLFDLLLAFKKALDDMPKVTYHEVKRIDINIEQQIQFILDKISDQSMIMFTDLTAEIKERIVIIVTFVALLELIRTKQIIVKQSEIFGDIRIKLNKENGSKIKTDR